MCCGLVVHALCRCVCVSWCICLLCVVVWVLYLCCAYVLSVLVLCRCYLGVRLHVLNCVVMYVWVGVMFECVCGVCVCM